MGQVSHNLHDDNMFQEKGAGGGGICKDFIHTCGGREIRERKKGEVLQSEFVLAFGYLYPRQALFYISNQSKTSII